MNSQTEHKIHGIVLDWAGTIVDFGSLAPMGAFVELFARHQVEITIDEARVPMGLPKIEHIDALGRMPTIADQWQALHGKPFSQDDAQQLLKEIEPMSAKAALDRSTFIPGFMTVYHALKNQGLAFATTTGYTRKIMTPLIEIARVQGFTPALVVCCDDVAHSRPDPMGMQACLQAMGLHGKAAQVIKVDDTAPGLAEGLAAGSWTVGVAISGNALGWTQETWEQTSNTDKAKARALASAVLQAAGAHEVIDSVAELPLAIARIEQRMAMGETP
jgi:phosphonoacetaldehyde hydrolase